ncbi:DUF2157 domain-containing protein [Erwinia sp. V71]|uniref:DUF2157 domain-containing protein n=1 Tax=Erwinia sp. V71 TaxID=3369424 RepID=UPI003F5FD8E7
MSKFRDINVKGQDNSNNVTQQNTGGNNVQNTSIINNKIINNNSGNQDQSGVGAIAFAGVFVLLVVIWSLFANIDKIYSILKLVTITSPALSITGVFILSFRNEISRNDVIRVILSSGFAGALFLLNAFFKGQIPQDIVDLSYRTDSAWDFWNGLNEHGKNNSIAILVSSIFIALSAIINHFISIRQFLYSLSDSTMTGFWYSMYKLTGLFRIRISGTLIIVLSVITTLALQGYIFHFNFK